MRYLDHIIIDEVTHKIQFDAKWEELKIRTIDYLSIYSNQLLIRHLSQKSFIFEGNEIQVIVMECRCDKFALKNFLNYLVS